MAQSVTLRALGLNYSPNELSLPEGSLTQADDIVIRRDNTVESRRGFSEYSNGIGLSTDRAQQLLEYKNSLLVHYSNKIAFDTGLLDVNGKAIFSTFDGLYTATQAGLRIKSIESNKNLYFTSGDGVKKISAKSSSDFTTAPGFITNAGAVKALNITASLDSQQGMSSGFLPVDSAVAYRAVWGYKDSNDNLLLGAPSNRSVVYNFLSDNTAMDLNAICVMLDTLNQPGSQISDGNYAQSFYSPVNSTAVALSANVLLLAAKLDNDLTLANTTGTGVPLTITAVALTSNKVTITFSTDPTTYFRVNDYIKITNLPAPFDVINGTRKIDVSVNTTSITFTLINANIASAAPAAGTINSYSYETITTTGSDSHATPLANLIISTPPTSEQQRTINNTLSRILDRLKSEGTGVISAALQTKYVAPITITANANTKVQITIPPSVTSQYFVQVYRSRSFTATDIQTLGGGGGVPIVPDDEMRLVYEGFPTTAELAAGTKSFSDSYPDILVQNNTNLYTNPETGEGILRANDAPPFANDIARFKNVTFYANTRTLHRIPTFQLLGVQKISNLDKITIGSSTGAETYTFVSGAQEITAVTCTAGAAITAGSYFEIYSTAGQKYRFWFEVSGAGTAPTQTGTVCVKVPILSTDTASRVAQRVIDSVNTFVYDFNAIANTLPAIRITCIGEGKVTAANAGTSGFAVTEFQRGDGEDVASKQILKSSLLSAAQAIDKTAQSFVRVVNKSSSIVNAFYISSDTSPPGQINLEAKTLSPSPFYVLGSNSGIGSSFNPDISPVRTDISSISVANPTVISTSSPHSLVNGDTIVISGSNSTPSVDGVYTVTVPAGSTTTFTIPIAVTGAGTAGSWSKTSSTATSKNEARPNRMYYSKPNQPDAVPILNYFPVGAEDKAILRIVPLRNSLFVFKEDGVYRVSGEVAPFVTYLLDSSCVIIAPDSIGITNNVIYAWTLKGITPVTESGAGQEISRPIDTVMQKLCSATYTNFAQVTFGFGYNSDSSYTIFTNSAPSDAVATVGFRYCTLTNTWTNVNRSQTCGIVMQSNDLLNMGDANSNIVHRERKNFNRTDFCDKSFAINLNNSSLYGGGTTLSFTSVADISVGDVLVQEQTLTTYQYNSLLMQMDSDPSVGLNVLTSTTGSGTTITVNSSAAHGLSNGDYVTLSQTNSTPALDGTYQISGVTSTSFTIQVASALASQATTGSIKRAYEKMFAAVSGDNMRDKIVALAAKIDTDPALTFKDYSSRIAAKSGTITANSIANPTMITTSAAHNIVNGRVITITGVQSPQSVPAVSGTYTASNVGTYGSSTQFSTPVSVLTAGGTGLSFSTAPNLNTFQDIKACYNDIIGRLNTDTGTTFKTYQAVLDSTTPFEAVVTSVDSRLAQLTTNIPLQWVVGPITVYKAIPCEFTYSPIIMGDPVNTKQLYDATFMFDSRAITSFIASFSSDLKPEFNAIPFKGDGDGKFGHYPNIGFGFSQFGGQSNSAPFRTVIPRDNMRCRFLNVKINHTVARELWSLYGITITGNIAISNRGYR